MQRLTSLGALAAACLASACATVGSSTSPLQPVAYSRATPVARMRPPVGANAGLRVADEASRAVGPGKSRGPADAASLVVAVHHRAGVELPSVGAGKLGVARLHRWAQSHGGILHGRPQPGDVAFFRDTLEARSALAAPTHAAVVERVEQDGTVVLVSRVKSGVLRLRMNLEQPGLRRDKVSGRVLNHYLRGATAHDRARTAAELFAGYARFHTPNAPALALR